MVAETTGQTPTALLNKPVLKLSVSDTWAAFGQLSGSRQMTMGGMGLIPLSEIAAYLEIYPEEDLDARDSLVRMIQALDSVYLKLVADRQPAEKQESARPRPPA